MKFRKEFLLLSIVSIIFLAGCTSSSSTGTGLGLSVQSFTPSPPSVEGGTPVLLTLQVQNTGESDATGVTAELIGLPYTISDRIKQVGTGTVTRADPQLGLPQGEQQIVLWDITTTSRDTTASYEAKARVTYNYVTSSENVIRVVSSDYYRTLSSTDQQALKRGIISSQFTKGPLTVTIVTPQPVVPRGTVALPVQIQVDNTGSGRAFLNSIAIANLDKVSLDASGLNCPTTEIRLVQGKSGRVTCQPSISVTDVTELQYKITLRYKYFVDSTTTFTVVKSLVVTPTTAPQVGIAPGAGNTCPSGYQYKSFLNQCRTDAEVQLALACEARTATNGRWQWNWNDQTCFFVPAGSTTPTAPRGPLTSLETTDTEKQWYKDNFFVSITWLDLNGLGSRKCQYITSGKTDWQTVTCSGTGEARNVQIILSGTQAAAGADCTSQGSRACFVRARITDSNNVAVSNIAEKLFNIDWTLPVISTDVKIDKPSDQSRVILNQLTEYSADATDATSGVKECRLSINGADQGAMTATGNTYKKAQTFTDQSAANVEAKITCKDNADNGADKTKTFTLDKIPPARSSPTANGNAATVSSPASLPVGTTTVSLGLTTNEDSTCKYNTTAAVTQTYDSLEAAFSTTGQKSHTTIVSGLSSGTKVYNIMCTDGGNKNTDAFFVKFVIS